MDASGASTADARFDVLLRDLLIWGLVERPSEASPPAWQLSPLAQRRLESLACPPPPASKVIFFGHRCTGCGQFRPTKFRAGQFICTPCLEEPGRRIRPSQANEVAEREAEYPIALEPPRRHHLNPVASARVKVLELSGSAAAPPLQP